MMIYILYFWKQKNYDADKRIALHIPKLEKLLDELQTINDVENEVTTISELLASSSESIEYAYNNILEQLDLDKIRIKELSLITNNEIRQQLESCIHQVKKYEQDNLKRQEQETLEQITKQISVIENEINTMHYNDLNSSVLSTIEYQLPQLKLAIKSLSLCDNSSAISNIQNCMQQLEMKKKEFSVYEAEKEKKKIANYNTKALNRIENVKNNSQFGWSDSNKTEKRIDLLKQLAEIQESYLYMPIQTLYSEVYGEIWKSLDNDSRFEIARYSLTVNKKDLDDVF